MENTNGESKIRKVLFNEVTLVVAVVGFVLALYGRFINPQQELNLAFQLQEQRIVSQRTTIDELTKTQQNDIKEVKGELIGVRASLEDLTNGVVELRTIINERIPARKL